MASKSKKSQSRERHRLPPEQQRELNNDGKCRRILCDILRLRVLAYIARQPAPFMFILSLFLISITLPLVGLYISRVDGLPDLDAMQVGTHHCLSLILCSGLNIRIVGILCLFLAGCVLTYEIGD